MHWLRTANDIAHDLSAGAWPGAAFAVWLVRSRADASLPAGTLTPSLPAWSAVFVVMVLALATLVVTGLMRVSYQGTGGSKTRLRTALAKHTVFTVVFVLATWLAIVSLRP